VKSQELILTTLCTKDALDVQQIILNSLELFLRNELRNIAKMHWMSSKSS